MSSSLNSGNGGGSSARYSAAISSSSGLSGTSSRGKIAVARPRRLDSKSRGGGSSLYMVLVSSLFRQRAIPGRHSVGRFLLRLIVRQVFLGYDNLFGRHDDDFAISHGYRGHALTLVLPQG